MLTTMRRRFVNISDRRVLGILIALFAFAVGVSVGAHFASREVNFWQWLDGFAQNFGTEMFGAFLTFLMIEVLVGARKERSDLITRVRQAQTPEERQPVLDELRRHDLLAGINLHLANLQGARLPDTDLSGAILPVANLQEADFIRANLQAANLSDAKLQSAALSSTNLRGAELVQANLHNAYLNGTDLQAALLDGANLHAASLKEANLQGARLRWANLQEADLSQANLREAEFYEADLKAANLSETNLQVANLWGSNLAGANLAQVKFNADTILPDGSKWTPTADLLRFTDPDHRAFWRSDYESSPAYRGAAKQDED